MGSQSKLEDRIAQLEQQVARANRINLGQAGPPPQQTVGASEDEDIIDELAAALAALDLDGFDPFSAGTIAMPPREDPEPEPGPNYKEWQERYKKEIAKELRARGFGADEVDKIINEFLEALLGYFLKGKKGRGGMLKFIFKNLKRLKDMYDAIQKARETVGEPPPKNT